MMTQREKLIELGYGDLIVFEDFDYDSAIIGVAEDRVVYSYDKMVEWLMINQGWSIEESMEWIDFNTIRSLECVKNGPIIVDDLPEF